MRDNVQELCTCLLRLSRENPVLSLEAFEAFSWSKSGESWRNRLSILPDRDLIFISGETIEVRDRLGIAEILLSYGRSPESVSELLSWREFEQFCRRALEENGFAVSTNFRFTRDEKRYEIDIIAARWPHLLFIDCKHWRPGRSSGLKRAAQKQRSRMAAASNHTLKFEGRTRIDQSQYQRLALLVSLTDVRRLIDGVPIVPIFRFNSFLQGLDQRWGGSTTTEAGEHHLENWLNL